LEADPKALGYNLLFVLFPGFFILLALDEIEKSRFFISKLSYLSIEIQCEMASSNDDGSDSEYVHPRGVPHFPGHERRSNTLPIWGNERTMNLNPLILTNIQTSHYFKSMYHL
jgi:hypothetical protein